MKEVFTILGILSMTFLSSCTYYCEGFDESNRRFVPYMTNDTIRYTNGIDTIVFNVTFNFKTEKRPFKTPHPVMDYWCDEIASYYASLNKKTGIYIWEEYHELEHFKVEFRPNDIFTFSVQHENEYENGIIKMGIEEYRLINGTMYINVYTLEKDRTKYFVWKMVKANDVGIVEFYTATSQKPWSLIN